MGGYGYDYWYDGCYVPDHTQEYLIRPTTAATEQTDATPETWDWWYDQQVADVDVFGGGTAVGDSVRDTFAPTTDSYWYYYGDYDYGDVLPGVGNSTVSMDTYNGVFMIDTAWYDYEWTEAATLSSTSAVSLTTELYGLGWARQPAELPVKAENYQASATATDPGTPPGASGDGMGASAGAGLGSTGLSVGGLGSPSSTSGQGQQTFNNLGQLTSLTNANGGVTQFSYDSAGNLASLTDPDNNTTSWTYDSQYNLTQETNQTGASSQFTYNSSGDLTSYTDKDGQVRTYQYNAQGEVSTETWYADAADAAAGQTRKTSSSIPTTRRATSSPSRTIPRPTPTPMTPTAISPARPRRFPAGRPCC